MMTETLANGKTYIHRTSAHCETGVTSALFLDKGIEISEPMIFGIGSGIFFGHLPFIKWTGLPISTFRTLPGTVFSKVSKRLGAKVVRKRFRNPQKGMDELRRVIRTGQIVAVTTNVYWLSYFPRRYRFNFSGHNLIVLYETENGFRVSDPGLLEYTNDCSAHDMERARFARGPMEARGLMYYPLSVDPNPDIRKACITGMQDSCKQMLKIPIPLFGVKGIRYLAKKIVKWPEKLGYVEACRQLAHLVRFQEEMGTGGAGFRYIFAAFLQESSELFESPELNELSNEMTSIGDIWREFALVSSRIIKQRKTKSEETFDKVGGLMMICAGREEQLFKNLLDVIGKLKS
ncbi:MAG: BtrH N-terminal domain-containing protein [Deltaproteobacteria bacterium]|nr:BtrH N-terminal domain-containing protein [Deltaproteobacteria bacterium]